MIILYESEMATGSIPDIWVKSMQSQFKATRFHDTDRKLDGTKQAKLAERWWYGALVQVYISCMRMLTPNSLLICSYTSLNTLSVGIAGETHANATRRAVIKRFSPPQRERPQSSV